MVVVVVMLNLNIWSMWALKRVRVLTDREVFIRGPNAGMRARQGLRDLWPDSAWLSNFVAPSEHGH